MKKNYENIRKTNSTRDILLEQLRWISTNIKFEESEVAFAKICAEFLSYSKKAILAAAEIESKCLTICNNIRKGKSSNIELNL